MRTKRMNQNRNKVACSLRSVLFHPGLVIRNSHERRAEGE